MDWPSFSRHSLFSIHLLNKTAFCRRRWKTCLYSFRVLLFTESVSTAKLWYPLWFHHLKWLSSHSLLSPLSFLRHSHFYFPTCSQLPSLNEESSLAPFSKHQWLLHHRIPLPVIWTNRHQLCMWLYVLLLPWHWFQLDCGPSFDNQRLSQYSDWHPS